MRIFKIFTVLVLVISFNLLGVSASNELTLSLGTINNIDEIEQDGLTYKYIELEDDKAYQQKIFYADFEPGENSNYEMVLHHIYDDNYNFTLSTLKEIADDYENQTGKKVFAAVNGDFFSMGAPVDYYAVNSDILNVGRYSWKNSFGFNNQGDTAIGRLNQTNAKLKIYVGEEVKEFSVARINEEPQDGEIAIFEPKRITEMNFTNTAKYIMNLDSNRSTDYSYPLRGTAYRLTTGDITTDESLSIKANQIGIAIKGDNELSQYFYNHYTFGTRIEVVKTPSGNYDGLNYVIGGYSVLAQNGIVLPNGAHEDNGGDSYAPRTSVGITRDGKFFINVIDGRQSGYSTGITVEQQGQLVYDLGADTALELDGGGSSTFLLRQDDELQLMNQPSDGTMRNVVNAVLIVEKETIDDGNSDDSQDQSNGDSTGEDTTDNSDDENNNDTTDDDINNIGDNEEGSTNTKNMVYVGVILGVLLLGITTISIIKKIR
ncbi:phosphodiester glycosidase family protein [Haloplasma contractile]|uniref:N-acetylglucosamine-1-phosphodiester alpha-N-acetylglucosaminidase-like exopolysaccharide bi protein n=1 Tax=Haloplasma contractile SSD-17B TaxID=1033810 RepID=U2FRR0_9MOLU|nr:phosphodiester glycosidase family protein [Haloplasma contractile]ERJ13649.1 N-acetylglucosamine-1-phosphodiester alpha-N-acetylglucosaminidase-like exopolysaccharide bi protein [Haloplasma contractile SSD-17B]